MKSGNTRKLITSLQLIINKEVLTLKDFLAESACFSPVLAFLCCIKCTLKKVDTFLIFSPQLTGYLLFTFI